MNTAALALVGLFGLTALYAYAGYPLILRLLAATRPRRVPPDPPAEWPTVSICLPAYNEESIIADTLERLLALDYPPERLQILVVSDASTDGTDDVVRSFSDRGVELLSLEHRSGKTAAENQAAPHLRGDIVVNTDATTRIPPGSLKPLVRAFEDSEVGVASGRDRSVGRRDQDPVRDESSYVGYEMWIRELETRLGTIVGASGCFYAIRRDLHLPPVPEALSRDFLAALRAREAGLRAVSVPDAVAEVPRARSLRSELKRKRRTMARGLASLWHKRHLLNPLRSGLFAWMLASHKLARWILPLALPAALLSLGWLSAAGSLLALAGLGAALVVAGLGAAALAWSGDSPLPGRFSIPAYVTIGMAAGLGAWWTALRGGGQRVWEPTRRDGPKSRV